jgi:hypothetical protein
MTRSELAALIAQALEINPDLRRAEADIIDEGTTIYVHVGERDFVISVRNEPTADDLDDCA